MTFDRSRLTIRSARTRQSRVQVASARRGLDGVPDWKPSPEFRQVVEWLRTRPGPHLWFLGGHVFKAGVGWYLFQLIRDGWLSHLATNGAGLVHDWELAVLGHTSEDVPTAIQDGSFGLWQEIGRLNEIVNEAFGMHRQGIGEHVGTQDVVTILSRAYRFAVPATVHVAIGQDVFFEHPNCSGAAWGECSYRDFLKLAATVESMEGGTFLCFGSAVCGPEVFLKALAMARNANQGKPQDIAVAVFDCVPLPVEETARYFHRPAKTLLGRVSEQSVFVQARHEESIPHLWRSLCFGGG